MTLKNLLKTGQLVEHEIDSDGIRQLLDAAHRGVQDAEVTAISTETRFDAAYRAIMQGATAVLWANGYRTSTSTPGHHRTTIQLLEKTAGLNSERIAVLERLRHKRNVIDYSGEDMDEASVNVCIQEAGKLIDDVYRWLQENRPELMQK